MTIKNTISTLFKIFLFSVFALACSFWAPGIRHDVKVEAANPAANTDALYQPVCQFGALANTSAFQYEENGPSNGPNYQNGFELISPTNYFWGGGGCYAYTGDDSFYPGSLAGYILNWAGAAIHWPAHDPNVPSYTSQPDQGIPTLRVYNGSPPGGQTLSDIPYVISENLATGQSGTFPVFNFAINTNVGCNYGSSDWLHIHRLGSGPIPAGGYATFQYDLDIQGSIQNEGNVGSHQGGGVIWKVCKVITFGTSSPPPNWDAVDGRQPVGVTLEMGYWGPYNQPCSIDSFVANPDNLAQAGGNSDLSWHVTNCPFTSLDGGAFSHKQEFLKLDGTGGDNTGPISDTTTYTLTAKSALNTDTATVTVTVGPANPNACTITQFQASPGGTLNVGESTTLDWATQNCDQVHLDGGNFDNKNEAPNIAFGSDDSGPLSETSHFRLTASGPVGNDEANLDIFINDPSICKINSFSANPNPIDYGATTTLSWTSVNCTAGTLSGGTFNNKNEVSQLNSGTEITSSLATDTTYTLNFSKGTSTDTKSLTVVVGPYTGPCEFGIGTLSANGQSGTLSVVQNTPITLAWTAPETCTDNTLTASGANAADLDFTSYGRTPVAANGSRPGYSTNIGTTTYELDYGVGANNSAIFLTINVTAPTPCTIGNITFQANGAASATVAQNAVASLAWNIPSSCASANLSASGVNDSGLSVVAAVPTGNRNASTVNIGATTYTLTVMPGSLQKTVTVTVTAPMTCTLIVRSYNNGSPGLPANGFSYTIVFPATGLVISDTLSSSNSKTYTSQPAGDVYTANDPTGYGAASHFVDITIASSQTCSNNATITFQYNFSDVGACVIDFNANPATINANSSANLTWTTTGCTSGSLSGGIFGSPPGTDKTANINSGSDSTGPLVATTTYTFSATGPAGPGTPVSKTVTVTSPPGPPHGCDPADPGCQGCQSTGACSGCQTDGTCPPPPAENTSINSGVACGQIKLSWAVPVGVTSVNIFRNTSNVVPGVVWQSGLTGNSYTDTAPLSSPAYYWLQSVNSAGTSSPTIAGNSPISATTCQVILGPSDKIVTTVNGAAQVYSSTCIGNQAGSQTNIKDGDTLSFSINICNDGSIDATNVKVTDDLAGSNLYNIRNISITGGGTSNTAGTITTFNLGTVAAGTKKIITYDVTVQAPVGAPQTLYRFHNVADITYDSSGGNPPTPGCNGTYAPASAPCRVDPGFRVFTKGSKSPTIKEVSP